MAEMTVQKITEIERRDRVIVEQTKGATVEVVPGSVMAEMTVQKITEIERRDRVIVEQTKGV